MNEIKLEAQWKKLIMANYAIDPKDLTPYLPYGTELDFYDHTCYVSLVGFMFTDTRFGGIRIPFHGAFEEVNLRFYIRRRQGNEWRRGVVFFKEIVPKGAVTFVANSYYHEHYETLPMHHQWLFSHGRQEIEYRWMKNHWHHLKIISDTTPKALVPGSAEDFFTEHYWGYTKLNDRRTLEYRVEHSPWQAYETLEYDIAVDFSLVYGPNFEFLTQATPETVFLAEGSGITLRKGDQITE